VALVERSRLRRALIVVPTHDHASTLDLAVASAQSQSIGDLEIVVIGDGVGDDTRDVMTSICRADRRVRFVDAPKSASRAEAHRHRVISSSAADIVTYLGDDDLLLPDHVEVMERLLDDHDFAHPYPAFIDEHEQLSVLPCDLGRPEWVAALGRPTFNTIGLTGAAHTMELYRRLPEGWTEPPPGRWSDHYFWNQIFAVPDVRLATATEVTVVKPPAVQRLGMSPPERRERLATWAAHVADPSWRASWQQRVANAVRAAAAAHHLDAVTTRWSLEESRALVSALNDEIDECRATTHRLDADLAEATGALLAAERELERLRDQVASVEATRTWRLRNRLVRSRVLRAVAARRAPTPPTA